MTVRSAVPAASPLSVWKRTSTAAMSANASRARTMMGRSRTGAAARSKRQTMSASASAEDHSGKRSTCSNTPPANAAQLQASGRTARASDMRLPRR